MADEEQYCDAQCARDLKFVGGKANVEGWRPSSNDPNAGVGPMGGCCAEIDIWYVPCFRVPRRRGDQAGMEG